VSRVRQPTRAAVPLALAWTVLAVGLALCAPVHAQPSYQRCEDSIGQVLDVIDARLALMPGVAAYKWQHHLPVADPPRERVVIEQAVSAGHALGFAAAPLRALFAFQIALARARQEALQAHWRRRGFDAPAVPSDLQSSLRPQLDALTLRLLRSLYRAAPVLRSAQFSAQAMALAHARLTAPAWSEASRSDLIAHLAAIRLDAAPGLERVRASGVLRIGTPGDYAPFSLERAGSLEGMDIVLAEQLARALGVQPLFVRTSWRTLLPDLRADAFDMAVGGISATTERAAAGALSRAYLHGGKVLLVHCAEARRFDTLAAVDSPQVRVVENAGGTNEQFARRELTHAHLTVVAHNARALDVLLQGAAQVMVTDDTEAALQSLLHPELCRSGAGLVTRADKVVLMAPDPALKRAVDGWLGEQLSAGRPRQWLQAQLSRAAAPAR